MRVLACLAEGLGTRATARVFEVDPNTVLRWLVEAAEQLKAFSSDFLCEVPRYRRLGKQCGWCLSGSATQVMLAIRSCATVGQKQPRQ